MNSNFRSILLWESLGSVCFVGICISGVYSVTYLSQLIRVYYQRAISPKQLMTNYTKYIDKEVLVAGPICSLDAGAKEVFKHEYIETTYFTTQKNTATKTQLSNFFLGHSKEILVKPHPGTIFYLKVSQEVTRPTLKQKLRQILELPIIFIKLIIGINTEYGGEKKSSKLEHGERVFVLGNISSYNKQISLNPLLITQDISIRVVEAVEKFAKSLILPCIFGIGLLTAGFFVRRLEKIQSNGTILAKLDAKCAVCRSNMYECIVKPCMHLCLCRTCFTTVTRCPLCREPIVDRVLIFCL